MLGSDNDAIAPFVLGLVERLIGTTQGFFQRQTAGIGQAYADGDVNPMTVREENFALGKALGLQIIAEGVEKESELEMLRDEGCDYFQGFLKSAPLTAVQFQEFAAQQN